jgi:hypothetical protein
MSRRPLCAAVFLLTLGAVYGPAAEAQQGPYQYFAITPCRIADTRSSSFNSGGFLNGSPNLPASSARAFFIKGTCGVPNDAKAVTVNAAILDPTAIGFLSMWPNPGAFPTVSTINFLAGEPGLANGAIVPVGPCTPPCGDLNVVYGNDGSPGHSLKFVLDVTGYFK